MAASPRPAPGTIVLAGLAVLVVAAAVVLALAGPPDVARYEPGTPEAAAQAYVQALLDGDFEAAHDLLAPALRVDCRPEDLRLGVPGDEVGTVRFEDVRVTGDRATITARLDTTRFEPAPLPVGGDGIPTRLVLHRGEGGWLIAAADWPLHDCHRR